MNGALAIGGDTAIGALAVAAALLSAWMAYRQSAAKKPISMGLWLLGGCLWALAALFFLAFQIRLM